MGRVVNWVYGLVLIFLALDAWKLGFLPFEFLPVAVLIMGALIMITKLGDTSYPNKPVVTTVIRFVLGAALIIMGIFSYVDILGLSGIYNVYTLAGQAIIVGIAIIYLFSGTPRSQMNIQAA